MSRNKKVINSFDLLIAGRPFVIQYVRQVDKEGSYGATYGAEGRILIKDGLSEPEHADTIVHEILHAILYKSGQSETLSMEQEEGIVIALENGLMSIPVISQAITDVLNKLKLS